MAEVVVEAASTGTAAAVAAAARTTVRRLGEGMCRLVTADHPTGAYSERAGEQGKFARPSGNGRREVARRPGTARIRPRRRRCAVSASPIAAPEALRLQRLVDRRREVGHRHRGVVAALGGDLLAVHLQGRRALHPALVERRRTSSSPRRRTCRPRRPSGRPCSPSGRPPSLRPRSGSCPWRTCPRLSSGWNFAEYSAALYSMNASGLTFSAAPRALRAFLEPSPLSTLSMKVAPTYLTLYLPASTSFVDGLADAPARTWRRPGSGSPRTAPGSSWRRTCR